MSLKFDLFGFHDSEWRGLYGESIKQLKVDKNYCLLETYIKMKDSVPRKLY